MSNLLLAIIIWGLLNCFGFTINDLEEKLTTEVFDKQGHRGARGLMPENTVPAFYTAIDLGVTTLEMDAVISADKKVVLSHDPYFNHLITTKPNGEYVTKKEEKGLNIFKMPYAEVEKYDVGLKPHPDFPQQQKIKAYKPLLSAVIDSVETYFKRSNKPAPFYNIETKSKPSTDNVYHPEPDEFVDLIVNVVLSKGIADRVIIQSFDIRTLQYLHQKYPAIKTSLLTEKIGSNIEADIKKLGFAPTIYSPHYLLVSTSMILKSHQKGVKVIPWTVNDKAAIEQLKQLGVDGIITDYPNFF